MREDTELLLQSYINAQYPIIYIDNTDFKAVDRLIAVSYTHLTLPTKA